MSSSTFTHEFTWSGEAGHVIATGSFDDWKSTLPLTKGADGKQSATVQIPYGEKITFKYVVDGNWQFNPNEPHETDASGNVNNVFTGQWLHSVPIFPQTQTLMLTSITARTSSAPAAPAVVETPAAAQTEAVVIPLNEVSQQQPVLPVPASINETTSTVDSVAQPTPVAAAVVETPAATPAATEEPKKTEEKPDLVSAATAGVAAIALGAAGLAGAAIHKVTGSDPVGIDPTPNKNLATKTEVPAEPTHTPATAPPTTSLPTVPCAATISTAVEKNEHVKTESDVKPVVAVAGVGATAAETAALATNAGETAGVHTAESSTFQQGEKYLKSFAAKHGKEKELHDIAVKADEYLAQAKAEGSKRFTEGEKMAGDAYEKVAATSFGASTMHALGLDKKASTPSTTTSPAALPKVEAVPDPAAPGNKLLNQTLGSTTAVTDPAAPKVTVAPTPAPAPASLSPASPASKSDGYSTAPSTPLKSAPATPSKGQSGVGHGDAPGTPSSTASKTRKPSFLKRLLGGSKSSPKAEE